MVTHAAVMFRVSDLNHQKKRHPSIDQPLWTEGKEFCPEGKFSRRIDPLAFADHILYERYGFSAEGIHCICKLVELFIMNATE